MADNTFPCPACGDSIPANRALPGSYMQCPSCQALVNVPGSAAERPLSTPSPVSPFRDPRETKRTVPLWAFFVFAFVVCVLAFGVILVFIQKGNRDLAALSDALQAAENAATPEEGLRIVEQVLHQDRFDAAQKEQARTVQALLEKRMQVDAAVAEAKRQEVARQAAVAAKPRPTPPPPPPELTLVDAQAAYEKGLRLACGNGVATNEAAAFGWITKAAGIGLREAQHDLAAMYAGGIGCATNLDALAEAMSWGRKAAAQGDAEAQAWLGYLYASAKDTSADPLQAAQWNEKAAVQGDATAAFNLALQYVNGHGVGQDYARAFALFRAAAAHGHAEAQANLGVMYWKGMGVEQNPTTAFQCFQKAQELGSVQGTFALGLLYGQGSGAVKDRQMAFACLLSAARSGHVGAQKQLGRMYLNGCGVPWSEQDAIAWYRAAAAQGDVTARQAVEAYHNTHLPTVFAACEACRGKGTVERICAECRGAGKITETVTSKSAKTCTCGWQMINGRCPNCGRTDTSAARTLTVSCPSCRGIGRQCISCERCGGSGQVAVAGPAQTTFAQLVNRPDPGITLTTSVRYLPVALHPFRTGVNRGGGI